MPVGQLKNRLVLTSDPIMELFRKAFTPPKGSDTEFPDLGKVMVWVQDQVESEHVAVFVTHEFGKFTGLAICQDWEDPFSGRGWVLQYYCENPRHSDELMKVCRDWFKEVRHCPKVRILNFTGRADDVHMRRFRKVGIGKRLAGLIEYDVI
jgi:hypothetical protein